MTSNRGRVDYAKAEGLSPLPLIGKFLSGKHPRSGRVCEPVPVGVALLGRVRHSHSSAALFAIDLGFDPNLLKPLQEASKLNRIIGCTPALRLPRQGNPDTSLAQSPVETGKLEWGQKSRNLFSIQMAAGYRSSHVV
ncbi:lysine histidine transporter-like 5-like protein [Cucumis melo var. makuwa]|uniref:Lysine histidine transporter-like 5-like protein n=1 Tax=Cucumis melo var. makuwa TaxID=1194695 RepID=A0A5A7UC42_CUCMM|nr:lysine histidine transporter-like 5-like protein [Cucumis melo var. makuwa]